MAAPIVTGIASLVLERQSFLRVLGSSTLSATRDTKYEVADSSSKLHLPTGTMQMVNAQLAVEAAIKSAKTTAR